MKYAWAGKVNLLVVMALLAGSTVGVQIGAAICQSLHGAKVRRYFAGIVLLCAVWLAADIIRLMFFR